MDGGDGTDAGDGAGAGPGDGGFVLPDAGVTGYVGEAEPGVRCGHSDETCGEGVPCCVELSMSPPAITGTCADTSGAEPATCEAGAFSFCCDGNEDCSVDGEVCCVTGVEQMLFDSNPSRLRGECMAAAECVNVTTPVEESRQQACINSDECPGAAVCCGLEVPLPLPIDLGVCAISCE